MIRAMFAASLLLAAGCAGGDNEGEPEGAAGLVFCDDRVDDDDDGEDEACPATQPEDGPPAFDCDTGAPPANVLAYAALPTNEQVDAGCVYLYQGETGAFFVAVDIVDGPDASGPMGESTGLCSYDRTARRHVFMTTAPLSDCEDLTYVYPDLVENQLLSNGCRRMVRNLGITDPDFNPDIQFLPGDLETQRQRIAVFDTVEVACLGINNTLGAPYRTDEVFVTHSSTPWILNEGFSAQP